MPSAVPKTVRQSSCVIQLFTVHDKSSLSFVQDDLGKSIRLATTARSKSTLLVQRHGSALAFAPFWLVLSPGGGGVLYIFWVRGRAIGKGIDFHDFGIGNGIDFRNFHNWYKDGGMFLKNWYKGAVIKYGTEGGGRDLTGSPKLLHGNCWANKLLQMTNMGHEDIFVSRFAFNVFAIVLNAVQHHRSCFLDH